MKTVEIIVKELLERPPLNTSGKYFKLYLPNDIVIRENQQKQINLNFQIKVPDNIVHQIISTTLLQKQPVEICGEILTTNSKYKKVILKLINKTSCSTFKFPKNTEIARLYFFTEQDEKIDTVYKIEKKEPNLNKTWLDIHVYFKQMKNTRNIK